MRTLRLYGSPIDSLVTRRSYSPFGRSIENGVIPSDRGIFVKRPTGSMDTRAHGSASIATGSGVRLRTAASDPAPANATATIDAQTHIGTANTMSPSVADGTATGA